MDNKESLFSTKRETQLTGSQMLENAIKRRQNQRRNMQALTEANKVALESPDFTATFESTNLEVENNIKKESILEQAAYRQGSKNIIKAQLGMRSRLVQEGKELVMGKVIGEFIYESYWLDDSVKESTCEQISESITDLLNYVEESCSSSKVKDIDHTRFMKNVKEAVDSVVENAVNRIMEEAEQTNSAFDEFELNESEEDELDTKLEDLGRDELVELVREKVAKVVQDEKEKGKERAEMFKEIDDAINNDESSDDEDIESDDDSSKESTEEDEAGEGTEESTVNTSGAITLESALKTDNTDGRYTSSERYISSILEAGAPFQTFEDPSWNEFKSYVSLLCKKIKNIIIVGNYDAANVLIDELVSKLSNVPETVPSDVTGFVMTMVNMIFGAVPVDEVIISRFRSPMGSPGLNNEMETNFDSISWLDLLANIKINLLSVREWCSTKNTSCGTTLCPENPVKKTPDGIEYVKYIQQMRTSNKAIGGSLFEAMMIGNISETSRIVTESGNSFTNEDVEDAALIETLLQYTVFETLDTLGLYNFRVSDIKTIKKDFMSKVSEGTEPVYGESDKVVVSQGMDKKGLKKVRINTKKLKRKSLLNKFNKGMGMSTE